MCPKPISPQSHSSKLICKNAAGLNRATLCILRVNSRAARDFLRNARTHVRTAALRKFIRKSVRRTREREVSVYYHLCSTLSISPTDTTQQEAHDYGRSLRIHSRRFCILHVAAAVRGDGDARRGFQSGRAISRRRRPDF